MTVPTIISNWNYEQPDGKRIVVVDINGLVRDARTAKRELMRKLLGDKLPKNVVPSFAAYDAISHELGAAYLWSSQHLHEYPEFMELVKPVEGAIEGLRDIRDADSALYGCSHRNEEEVAVQKIWLQSIGAYIHERRTLLTDLIPTNGLPKARVLQPLGTIDGFVDDNSVNFEGIRSRSKFLFGLAQPLPAGSHRYERWGSGRTGLAYAVIRGAYQLPTIRLERRVPVSVEPAYAAD